VTQAPDFVEPFHGWRVWRVAQTARGLRLWSVLYDDAWEPRRPFRARCPDGHSAPDHNCACGIYGARAPTAAARYLLGRNDPVVVHRVIGLVALWGTVFAGERGWRASVAYPARLWVPESPRAAEVAEVLLSYGVPFETLRARRTVEIAAEVAAAA
jgi:hypothetical protein